MLDSCYTVGIDWIRMQPPEVGRESREWIATYGKDSRERALCLAHLLTTAPEVTHPDQELESVLFAECKGPKEKNKEAQEDWVAAAIDKGVSASNFAVAIRVFT